MADCADRKAGKPQVGGRRRQAAVLDAQPGQQQDKQDWYEEKPMGDREAGSLLRSAACLDMDRDLLPLPRSDDWDLNAAEMVDWVPDSDEEEEDKEEWKEPRRPAKAGLPSASSVETPGVRA